MPRKKNRQRNQLIVTACVMGLLLLAAVVTFVSLSGTESPPQKSAAPAPIVQADPPPAELAKATPSAAPALVEDDGRTLWASPTEGTPLDLAGLPPGCQLMLSIRPAAMLESNDGRLVFELFRSSLAPLRSDLAKVNSGALESVDRLTIGVRPGAAFGQLEIAYVVDLANASDPADKPTVIARGATGAIAWLAPQRLLFAPRAMVDEVLPAPNEPPPMRRELEQLVAASDQDRHASLMVTPNFLFAEGRPVFAGSAQALREPFFEELPDDFRGLLVSTHMLQDNFYWEVRAAAAADMTASEAARLLDGRINQWPSELQLALLDLNPAPHGRRLVANLPAMSRLAAEFTRRGVEDRQAVLNGYLPAGAGHNLLMAAELMLAQLSAGGAPAATPPPRSEPKSAIDRLRQRVTISFDRDTLEMALAILSNEIDVPIIIQGGDLQLEGITKNQSFGLDQQDRRAGEVLVEILRRANPDKTAAGPTDPKQKLVFVLKPDADGRETIYVTTRAAAEKRGDRLPSIFRE